MVQEWLDDPKVMFPLCLRSLSPAAIPLHFPRHFLLTLLKYFRVYVLNLPRVKGG